MSKYQLQIVNDFDAWDVFVDASPQGTLFSSSGYMRRAVDHWCAYWVLKGNQVKGGLCIIHNHDDSCIILDDLVIHDGIIFAEDGDQKPTKARLARFEITDFIVGWLDRNYQSVELSLSPFFEDMRAFQWHNYHAESPSDKYCLDLRYTSFVDIQSLLSVKDDMDSQLFLGLETLRQRNIREARRSGAITTAEGNGSIFAGFYAEMMAEQGETQSNDKLDRLASLIDGLIADKTGVMLITRNGQGHPIYATVFGWDSKRAYYLFGAPVPGYDERYKGTVAFWDAFKWLASHGIKTVDMEGVNSPRRGWFKLSFGGDLRPYYHVSKQYRHA